jgi:hypothetical protein
LWITKSQRGTVNIYEEFRMIKKEVIDSVLSPFLIVRQPPYLKKPEYAHLKEEPMEIYISSSWFKSHWMWQMMKIALGDMYKKDEALLIGFDYSITLKHGIRTRKQLEKEKKKLGNMAFDMEYGNLMLGTTENAYYTYELINSSQLVKKAFYTRKDIDVLEHRKNKLDVPKQKGEIRIVSVDISTIVRKGNDNTAISCIRALQQGDNYERQLPYIEAFNGGNTTEQAIRIKQIFTDFNADFLVLDGQSSGINVFDELGKVLFDERRDCEYPAWTSFNDSNAAERIKNRNALPVVYIFKGNAGLNSDMHLAVRDALEKKKIKLLINSTEARDYLETKKEYRDGSMEEKVDYEYPYMQTDLLINEMINLSYEMNDSSRLIKLIEPRNGVKDRYISFAMGNYYIKQLEMELSKDDDEYDWSSAPTFATSVDLH